MRLIKSFKYAFEGIISVISEQLNMKIHCIACVVVITAGFYFHVTNTEWFILIFAMVVVLVLEMINSAIENIVDLISPTQHPTAGKIKDMAAGAVLIAALGAAVVGIIIFYKYVDGLI